MGNGFWLIGSSSYYFIQPMPSPSSEPGLPWGPRGEQEMAFILEEPTAWQGRWPLMWATMGLAGPYVPGTPSAFLSGDWERHPGVICEEGARVGSVAGCRIPGWALASVFPPTWAVSVRCC